MASPVIVGVDGSPTSRKAAESAARLASALGVPLHVVSAYPEQRSETISSGSDQWVVTTEDNARYTAEQVAEGLSIPGVTVTAESAHGKPAEALIEYAERVDAEMIVVGNQRMRGVQRVLGSVANSVSHNATRDVHIANTYGD